MITTKPVLKIIIFKLVEREDFCESTSLAMTAAKAKPSCVGKSQALIILMAPRTPPNTNKRPHTLHRLEFLRDWNKIESDIDIATNAKGMAIKWA